MNPSDPQNQQQIQNDALKKYQEMLAQQQQQLQWSQLLNAFSPSPMGVVGSNAAYGPAGQLTRSGLGSVKAVSLMPEETVVEALVGWRRWTVTMFGEELMSNNGTVWKPYEKLTAACAAGIGCAGTSCGCGIYAYKERKRLESGENSPLGVTHVWGQVSLWGRVIEHKAGFRAQFAYPRAIVNTGGIAERMAYVYGVPVIE